MTRSLQGRLVLGLVVSLIAVAVLQWLLVSKSIRGMMEEYVTSRLTHDTESLLTAVDASGGLVLEDEKIDAIYRRPFSGHYFKITGENATLRSRSLWEKDIEIPAAKPGESFAVRKTGPKGQSLIVIVSGYVKHQTPITIAVAEDLSRMESDILWFQKVYAAASILALIALILVQWLIVRAGLSPLARARDDVLRLEKGEAENIGADVPSEVRPLVEEINRLLGVMRRRIERSRKALGNLAHALKTPLTTLTRLAEDGKPLHDDKSVSILEENTKTIQNLIERELARARLAGAATPGRNFDAEKEIPDLAATLEKIYRGKGLSVRWSVSPGFSLQADREDMIELLGVLMDNACKWAKSRVTLAAEDSPGHAFFTVEDDGPGQSQEDMEALKARGARFDESAAGHGLGLSIASDIVDSYSGALEFGRSEALGGLLVRAIVPKSADALPSSEPS